MNNVYPIGYSALGAQERIDELTKQPNVLLIDTRIKPWSWNQDWRKEALEKAYGERYKWAGKYLGNAALGTGRIEIAEPLIGIPGLIKYLREQHDLILLCQCQVYNDCHVRSIVDFLLQKVAVEVVRFGQGETKGGEVAQDHERMIICQRSGKGKGCSMTWALGDKVWAKINGQDIQATIRAQRMNGLSQVVKLQRC